MSTVDATIKPYGNELKSQLRRQPIFGNRSFGMTIFVFTEVMFFMALLSAYAVIKSTKANWVPPGEITLPMAMTAFNTLMLFVSGIMLFLGGKHWKQHELGTTGARSKALSWTLKASLFGGLFLLFQGYEWLGLLNQGMTLYSGVFAACFYLLVGMHGLHVLFGVLLLIYSYLALSKGKLNMDGLRAAQIFWYFVVGIWPLLYATVYW